MTRSWEAFFFGSLDAGNVITVDKPPASLWVMAAVGADLRVLLVEHAGAAGADGRGQRGAAVRGGAPGVRLGAGLLAGAVLALTPVAALMFRFNNPDALLVLLMVAAAYATVRAIERAGTRWLLLAGVFIGFAFLAKMAAGVPRAAGAGAGLPGGRADRRSGGGSAQLLGAAAAVVVSAGWYVAMAELWPAASRPYIGGSDGQQRAGARAGLQRAGPHLRRERRRAVRHAGGGARDAGRRPRTASAGGPGGPGGGGFGGQAGLPGCSTPRSAARCRWLLPAALSLLVAGLWLRRRRPRTDPVRASLLLLGRLDRGHGAGVQPGRGHLPRLLHGGAGPRDRRADRHRRPRAVAAPDALAGPDHAGRGGRRHRGVGVRPARPHAPDVPALAALGGPGRRRADRRSACWSADARPPGRRRRSRWPRCSPGWPHRPRTPCRPRRPRTPAASRRPGRPPRPPRRRAARGRAAAWRTRRPRRSAETPTRRWSRCCGAPNEVVGGHRERHERGVARPVQRHRRDEHRRVHRLRPGAHPGAVPGLRGRRQGALLRRGRWDVRPRRRRRSDGTADGDRARPWRPRWHRLGDQHLGPADLHLDHGRRHAPSTT